VLWKARKEFQAQPIIMRCVSVTTSQAPSVASVATSKNCRVSILMLAAQLVLCETVESGDLLR